MDRLTSPPPAPPGDDPLLGRTVNQYRVEERLGGGGMGVVYRARDLRLDRDVALKFLPAHLHADPDARDRLVGEAKAVSALDHQNVATVYEIGEADDGRLFLAMACYRGETLKKKAARGPLPVGEAVEYVRQAACGLGRAHRAGIVHRDVKPANLIVTDEGEVKVLDFGIATSSSEAGGSSGSAPYMSPEQARGEPTDARTDVWGLGVTLYELLAGGRPFGGAFTTATLYAVLHTEPRPLGDVRDDLPPGLADVVARCLAKSPADRFQDVDALREALRPFGPEGRPAAGVPLGRLRVRLRRLPPAGRAGLAVAAVLVVGALAWAALRPSGPDAQHLAVLPFRTPGGDAETEVLAAGLLETVTSRLSQLEQFDGSMWVVPASEVGSGMSPSDARDQLGATLAVDGTVQVEDGRVRLLLNLIDTETRRVIASSQVDADSGSALAIQDRAVLQLAQLLQVQILPRVREALTAGGTDDDVANDLYLRGRGALREEQSVDDVERAAGLLRQAVERDPSFALAHAALGEALWRAYVYTSDPAQADEAVAHSERALRLEPESAPVHVSLAVIHAGRGDYGRALDALDQALAIDPGSAEAVRRRAIVLRDQGQFEEAEAAYRRTIAMRPGDWRSYNSLGIFYYLTGRVDEAVAAYGQALDLVPSNLKVLGNLGAAYWEDGRVDEAVDVFERILRLDRDNAAAGSNLATALFYQGKYARAAELYAREQARRPDSYQAWLDLGAAQWWAPGQRDDARRSYRRALDSARRQLAVARSEEVIGALADAHAKLGARDSAAFYLAELVGPLGPEEVDAEGAFGVGQLYELLDDRDEAVRWTRSALDRGYGAVTLERSPWLRSLRRDPALARPPPSP